jgi:hypothetical protein
LPGITVAFFGNLQNFAASERRINSDALDRELAVRRMEHNVQRLEQLRREDERRAREEAERRRRRELEGNRIYEQVPGPQPLEPMQQ